MNYSATEYAGCALRPELTGILGDFQIDTACSNALDTLHEQVEVIYYSEAEEVLERYGTDFGDAADEYCFKEYKAGDWRQARQDYANYTLLAAAQSALSSLSVEVESNIELFRAEVDRLQGDADTAHFSSDCLYGIAAHNYETSEGVMIWSDEPGHYNPELLAGELVAVSFQVSWGVWLNAAWPPYRPEDN